MPTQPKPTLFISVSFASQKRILPLPLFITLIWTDQRNISCQRDHFFQPLILSILKSGIFFLPSSAGPYSPAWNFIKAVNSRGLRPVFWDSTLGNCTISKHIAYVLAETISPWLMSQQRENCQPVGQAGVIPQDFHISILKNAGCFPVRENFIRLPQLLKLMNGA